MYLTKYLLFAFLIVLSGEILAEQEVRTITINGQGSVATTPTVLNFSVYVEERGESASKLAIQVNYKTRLIIDLLTDNGVLEKDIRSMRLNLNPWHSNEGLTQTQKGFVLSRHISITLRDFSKYALLLDELIKVGAQRIDSFQYRIENAELAYLQALERAIDDAKVRAKKAAKALGVKVGDVVHATEQSRYTPRPASNIRVAESFAGDSFLPGQQLISASVSVQFEITD